VAEITLIEADCPFRKDEFIFSKGELTYVRPLLIQKNAKSVIRD
jgi:hypothetical protein